MFAWGAEGIAGDYRHAGEAVISWGAPWMAPCSRKVDGLRLIVTGGAGFIGSALVRLLVEQRIAEVVVIDKLTYAACPEALDHLRDNPRFRLVRADIADAAAVRQAIDEMRPDGIVHLAAETHVDRSIDGPGAFIQTNVVGTSALLDAALDYWRGLEPEARQRFRFLHVSTDEVYGPAEAGTAFREGDRYRPSSPYAASKAASDHLALAWHRTYGLPVLVSLCTNNFGPWQFPEKLIPLTLVRAMEGQPIRIYGDGRQIRDWLYVDDHARGIVAVLQGGRVGESYHLGSALEMTNLELVGEILRLLERARPIGAGDYRELITHVADRPGHDRRYALDCRKSREELGWSPHMQFSDGLEHTVRWYLDHADWWRPILDGRYAGERLGLTAASAG